MLARGATPSKAERLGFWRLVRQARHASVERPSSACTRPLRHCKTPPWQRIRHWTAWWRNGHPVRTTDGELEKSWLVARACGAACVCRVARRERGPPRSPPRTPPVSHHERVTDHTDMQRRYPPGLMWPRYSRLVCTSRDPTCLPYAHLSPFTYTLHLLHTLDLEAAKRPCIARVLLTPVPYR